MEGQLRAHDMATGSAPAVGRYTLRESRGGPTRDRVGGGPSASATTTAGVAGWDRAQDRTQVRITSKAEFAIAQVEEAIHPLLPGADIETRDVAVEAPLGAKLSSKRVLWFSGETRKATRRADNFVEQLRGPGGWQDVLAQLSFEGTERILSGQKHAAGSHGDARQEG